MIGLIINKVGNIPSQRVESFEKKVNQHFQHIDGTITLNFSKNEDPDKIVLSEGLLEFEDNVRILWHQSR